MKYIIYDYVDANGKKEFRDKCAKFFKRRKKLLARFNEKIDSLETSGVAGGNLFTPTREKKIFELRINGEIALRVLSCRNIIKDKNGDEITELILLYPATERDNDYEPNDAPELAEKLRKELFVKNEIIEDRRCLHEPIEPKIKKKLR